MTNAAGLAILRPMSSITRYLLRQLTVGMVFISIALACVLWLTQSSRLIEMIVTNGLSVTSFLELTLLLMPTFLMIIIPISLFAVVLFVYNKLNADRELVVLRAIGLSHWSLGRPALILAGAATALSYLMTLLVIPASLQTFREMQWDIRHDVTSILLQEGTFNKFGDGMTIYVRSRNAKGELLGILIHDKRSPEKPVTMMAERGALVFTEEGPRVLMINGSRQQLTPGTGRLSLLYFDSYTVDMESAIRAEDTRFRDARERSLAELVNADPNEMTERDYRRAKVELHQRFISPLYCLGFTLIALACLLPAGFDRRGQGIPILSAIGLMVAVQAAALGVSNLAARELAFTPLIYVVALLPIGFGAWFIERPNFASRRVSA